MYDREEDGEVRRVEGEGKDREIRKKGRMNKFRRGKKHVRRKEEGKRSQKEIREGRKGKKGEKVVPIINLPSFSV